MSATTYTCEKCQGTAVLTFEYHDGTVHTMRCSYCRGGSVTIDPDAIRAAITASRGKRAGLLLASGSMHRWRDVDGAYYVWRMARFHGGADVTLPFAALFDCPQNAAAKEALDTLADAIAKETFGSDLRGAIRWGRALGYL